MRKFLLLMIALLTGISGAWAETYTITYDHRTGTFYKGGAVSTGWVNQWVSNEAGKPSVTITASANNINTDNGRMAPGSSTTCTYTITTEDGYVVTGFSMNCPTSGAQVTVTPAGESAIVVAAGGTLVVNSSASSFVYSGSNSGRIQASAGDGGSFTITVEDIVTVPTTISDEAYVKVGEKVASFTAATDAADNDHWYILTQIRDGESPMYDAGTGSQLKRTATSITPATINGTKAASSTQYLIRLFDAGDGLYNIQFADGNFITSSLTTSPATQAAGKYAFYNTNSGNGSYFGWNLNSNTGSRVDNNGPTYTVSFWGSGTISGTSGNNVWYLYPAELEVPSTTYVYEIRDASGVVFTSDPISGTAGETISTMPSGYQLDYCNYTVTPKTLESGENTVSVTVTYNLPFTASTSFADATWYYATLRGKQLRADDSAKDDSGRYATNSTNEKTDAYKWAFFGNPYTGIYVMNKNQGSGKYMYKETQIVFSNSADPTADNKALWAITPNNNGGFTLRSYTGATMYVNDAGGGGNLGFWNSSAGANDAGSNWVVEAVPAEVTVTYDLYVGGGKVNTVNAIAPANSEVDIPASLVAGYSTFAYDITYTGTIGNDDCTIDVTATLKDGIVQPAGLSNSKKYHLTCERGSLSTYTDGEDGTFLASPVKTALGIEGKDFAIIEFESRYYLYSVEDKKFVTYSSAQIAPLAATVTGTSDAISFSQTTNSVYEILFDNSTSKILNSSASYEYGIVINGWGASSSEWDGGCQYIIEEIGDYDASEALDALEDFFNGTTAFANAIAELKAVNWGLTASGNKGKPNYYNFIGDYIGYAGNEMGIIGTLESAGYSPENLAIAQDILANYALNMPSAGFYRIKGKTNNKYLAAGSANNGKYNMSEATDATTIFYFNGKILTNFSSGMCNGVTASSWEWVTGENASTVVFENGETNGGYLIHTSNAYLFDGGTSADRGGGYDSRAQYRSWYLEEITTLPITIGALGWASFCAPVAVAIPEGVNAYYIEEENLSDVYVTLTEITTGEIPAGKGVILRSDEAASAEEARTYDFEISNLGTSIEGNVLEGVVAATDFTDREIYTLQRQNVAESKEVGLFPKAAGTLVGFKAYLPSSVINGTNVKGFIFNFDVTPTGISMAQGSGFNAQDAEIYNLAGQRISKLQRGVNVVNGKKVIVK